MTFWAASYIGSTIYRFDIATGQLVTMFATGDIKVGGLAIYTAGAGPPATPDASSGVVADRTLLASPAASDELPKS